MSIVVPTLETKRLRLSQLVRNDEAANFWNAVESSSRLTPVGVADDALAAVRQEALNKAVAELMNKALSSANKNERRPASTDELLEKIGLLTRDDITVLQSVTGSPDVMAHYVDRTDPSVGWALAKTRAYQEADARHWQEYGFGAWRITHKSNDDLIGFCGLHKVNWLPAIEPAVEVSYYLHPSYWRQGLGPEALAAAVDWAFNQSSLGLESIVGCVVEGNDKSARGLEKLGMRYEDSHSYTSETARRDAIFNVFRLERKTWMSIRDSVLQPPDIASDLRVEATRDELAQIAVRTMSDNPAEGFRVGPTPAQSDRIFDIDF